MGFKDDSFFMDKVKENDILGIKSALESIIKILNGDEKEIENAINFARENSTFDWEIHREFNADIIFTNKEMEYSFEKGKLVRNFSRERFDKVLKLFKETRAEKTAKYKVENQKSEEPQHTENCTFKEQRQKDKNERAAERKDNPLNNEAAYVNHILGGKKQGKKKSQDLDSDQIKARIVLIVIAVIVVATIVTLLM